MPGAIPHQRILGAQAMRAVVVGLAVAGSLLAVAGLANAPSRPDSFAAVFPPWWSGPQAAGAAARAGDIAGVGALPFILILKSRTPGLGERLRRAGALILLDPRAAGLCARPPTGTPS